MSPVDWCVDCAIEKEKAMTEARELGRLYMKAAGATVTTIADHNRKSMRLSGASALRSLKYLTRLAGAKTGLEAIEVLGAHYRNQLNALGEHTDNLVDLARNMQHMSCSFRVREGAGSKVRCRSTNEGTVCQNWESDMAEQIPPIIIARRDHARLRLADDALRERHPVGRFLMSEVRRAALFETNQVPEGVACLDEWVTYRINGSRQSESKILVCPDELRNGQIEISVLSPLVPPFLE